MFDVTLTGPMVHLSLVQLMVNCHISMIFRNNCIVLIISRRNRYNCKKARFTDFKLLDKARVNISDRWQVGNTIWDKPALFDLKKVVVKIFALDNSNGPIGILMDQKYDMLYLSPTDTVLNISNGVQWIEHNIKLYWIGKTQDRVFLFNMK